MPKVGDKYIIEIESVYGKRMEFPAKDWKKEDPMEIQMDAKLPKGPNRIYKIKGFNTLVFDDSGLDKLEKYEENQHEPPPEEIVVGDEVAIPDGRKFVATYVSKTDNYVAGLDQSGNIVGTPLGTCVRTGRAHKFLADAVRSLKE